MVKKYDIKDLKLADKGKQHVEWAESQMDVLRGIRERFIKQQPLKGVRIAACLHVTTETAVLAQTLKAGGAQVTVVASNPLSTQDTAAAALVKYYKIPVFAKKGEDRKTYYQHLNLALDKKPQITMDDGADLVSLLHGKRKDMAQNVWGSTEETTTGVIRLKAMEKAGKLQFGAIAVNDSKTKHMFDNRYGTGQSTIDGILRATNILLAGKVVVVAGYGWCGRGLAYRARGMGSRVVITEIDPLRALEATMDGFTVMPMEKAVVHADVVATLTGDIHVVDTKHFLKMKDGAIVCNSGHFDVEINLDSLRKISKSRKEVRPFTVQYTLKSGKRIMILGEGRLINLASAEGHPASVMDMSFANQALAAEYIVKNHHTMEKKVYSLPKNTDDLIAKLKLAAMELTIDELSAEQKKYLTSWEVGT
ncbi:MAG: adenosylhomocysteinase [Candidatus Kerfeldbacteria bacterium RIFOXYB2_FULL_38_14]|uniref:Adenosylhomocysteinase n=1 Tax=Candidatus Kerfeldbacteria bacterium RIFOXYB2_FULL_38_14 TaxID=1798547 RepID=A0A1G2BAT1_9BACT|nr:MAG: adenosylhomocysteinase [Candidatus Kerfeldbacteria bacterium RIFOXYB2_FULL_38_14]